MVAYNFQARFAPMVERGEKRQTIRAVGKRRHAHVGEPVQLYTGMRTKACRKLIEPDPVCVERYDIRLTDLGLEFWDVRGDLHFSAMSPRLFANRDGFRDFDEMLEFFEGAHGLPFQGVLIGWELAQ